MLIGDIHNPKVAVYQATEYREKPVKESMDLIIRDVKEYNAKALKIKVGGLMFGTEDMYAVGPPGRTEEIIPLVRKTFGDKMVLYADSNGFYTPEEAIRVGRLLEEYRFEFFEEPVPFDWYEETKQVADSLSIPVAGGEQEYSLHGFRWLIANDGLQVVQPDNYYFGGMIRSMKAALMANAFGKKVHSSYDRRRSWIPLYDPFCICFAKCPSLSRIQGIEYRNHLRMQILSPYR